MVLETLKKELATELAKEGRDNARVASLQGRIESLVQDEIATAEFNNLGEVGNIPVSDPNEVYGEDANFSTPIPEGIEETIV